MAIEAKRGCGYRKVGGLYLVGGGLSAPCDRMPYPLDRCRTCGGGIKFTRGHTWLQPDFFPMHEHCHDPGPCPVCGYVGADKDGWVPDDFGPHILLWIGRGHYSPDAFLKESRELGVSRRIAALPKGFAPGETWVLLAHLDAVPALDACARLIGDGKVRCGAPARRHGLEEHHVSADGLHHTGFAWSQLTVDEDGRPDVHPVCQEFQVSKPTPGIFCVFVPRAVELILKESDATPERREKEAKRGVTVVAVPDDDRDHQGSIWDKDDEDSQPELPGVAP
jgi:hypothetical protein